MEKNTFIRRQHFRPRTLNLLLVRCGCGLFFYRGAENNALLIMPVASIYRSTHLEMQLLSPPLRLDPGFVMHFSKHFPLTVCTISHNWNQCQ